MYISLSNYVEGFFNNKLTWINDFKEINIMYD